MGRTAGHADLKMLAAARELARARGSSDLSVREVVAKAGVNLGMFHYHFKNKKRFTRVLLQNMYENFFDRLTVASKDGPDALAQLGNSLRAMGMFIRDERELCTAIVTDLLNGDPEVVRFVQENVPRHAAVIAALVARCQHEGRLVKLPFAQTMAFLMTSLHGPTFIGGILEKRAGKQMPGSRALRAQIRQSVLSDAAVTQRVNLALKGLAP